jgi:hypothetical protein
MVWGLWDGGREGLSGDGCVGVVIGVVRVNREV